MSITLLQALELARRNARPSSADALPVDKAIELARKKPGQWQQRTAAPVPAFTEGLKSVPGTLEWAMAQYDRQIAGTKLAGNQRARDAFKYTAQRVMEKASASGMPFENAWPLVQDAGMRSVYKVLGRKAPGTPAESVIHGPVKPTINLRSAGASVSAPKRQPVIAAPEPRKKGFLEALKDGWDAIIREGRGAYTQALYDNYAKTGKVASTGKKLEAFFENYLGTVGEKIAEGAALLAGTPEQGKKSPAVAIGRGALKFAANIGYLPGIASLASSVATDPMGTLSGMGGHVAKLWDPNATTEEKTDGALLAVTLLAPAIFKGGQYGVKRYWAKRVGREVDTILRAADEQLASRPPEELNARAEELAGRVRGEAPAPEPEPQVAPTPAQEQVPPTEAPPAPKAGSRKGGRAKQTQPAQPLPEQQRQVEQPLETTQPEAPPAEQPAPAPKGRGRKKAAAAVAAEAVPESPTAPPAPDVPAEPPAPEPAPKTRSRKKREPMNSVDVDSPEPSPTGSPPLSAMPEDTVYHKGRHLRVGPALAEALRDVDIEASRKVKAALSLLPGAGKAKSAGIRQYVRDVLRDRDKRFNALLGGANAEVVEGLETVDSALSRFGGARVIRGADGVETVVMPDGTFVRVVPVSKIPIADTESFRAEYGAPPTPEQMLEGARAQVTPLYLETPDGEVFMPGAIIRYATGKGVGAGELLHEMAHVAEAMGYGTAEKWAAAIRTFGSADRFINAMAFGEGIFAKKGTIWQKASSAFRALVDLVRNKDRAMARALGQGILKGEPWKAREWAAGPAMVAESPLMRAASQVLGREGARLKEGEPSYMAGRTEGAGGGEQGSFWEQMSGRQEPQEGDAFPSVAPESAFFSRPLPEGVRVTIPDETTLERAQQIAATRTPEEWNRFYEEVASTGKIPNDFEAVALKLRIDELAGKLMRSRRSPHPDRPGPNTTQPLLDELAKAKAVSDMIASESGRVLRHRRNDLPWNQGLGGSAAEILATAAARSHGKLTPAQVEKIAALAEKYEAEARAIAEGMERRRRLIYGDQETRPPRDAAPTMTDAELDDLFGTLREMFRRPDEGEQRSMAGRRGGGRPSGEPSPEVAAVAAALQELMRRGHSLESAIDYLRASVPDIPADILEQAARRVSASSRPRPTQQPRGGAPAREPEQPAPQASQPQPEGGPAPQASQPQPEGWPAPQAEAPRPPAPAGGRRPSRRSPQDVLRASAAELRSLLHDVASNLPESVVAALSEDIQLFERDYASQTAHRIRSKFGALRKRINRAFEISKIEGVPGRTRYNTDSLAPRAMTLRETADMLRRYLDEVEQQNASVYRNVAGRAVDALLEFNDLLRSTRGTADDSVTFNQLGTLMGAHPSWIAETIAVGMRCMFDRAFYERMTAGIMTAESFRKLSRAGAKLTEPISLQGPNVEPFGGTWAEKIPGVRQVTEAGSRAFAGARNHVLFRKLLFEELRKYEARLGREAPIEVLREFAHIGDVLTGRSPIRIMGRDASVLASAIFWAPRFAVAKVRNALMWDTYNDLLLKGTGFGAAKYEQVARAKGGLAPNTPRMMALRNQGGAIATALGATLIAKAIVENMGLGKVSLDPEDPAFMQLKIGKRQVIDLTNGLASTWRMLMGPALLLMARKRGKSRSRDAMAQIGTTLWKKMSPLAGTTVSLMAGKDPTGKKFTWKDAAAQSFVPLSIWQAKESWGEQPLRATPAERAAWTILHAGLNALGVKSFTMKPKMIQPPASENPPGVKIPRPPRAPSPRELIDRSMR